MIDYTLLGESINYYSKHGFNRVEVPWMVCEFIENITKPIGVQSFQLKNNNVCLIASAEQGFLELYLKNFLNKGTYQSCSPCFRYDDFDWLHSNTFMKNELIKTDVVDLVALDKMVDKALGFYRKYIPHAQAVETAEGFDIEINGLELGSYGIRSCDFLDWIYGTACAEPRTSKLIEKYG